MAKNRNTKTLKELAQEYNITPETLSKELKRLGFQKSRKVGRLFYPIDIQNIYALLGKPILEE